MLDSSLYIVNHVHKSNSKTALHFAAGYGHVDLVALLLERRANVNALDIRNCAPLHIASRFGHSSIVKLLVEHHADISSLAIDEYRHEWFYNEKLTPIEIACEYGHLDVIEYLVANGASVNALNAGQSSPLHYAVFGNQPAVANYLIAHGANVNFTSMIHGTALIVAAQEGNADMTRLLLDHGALVNEAWNAGSLDSKSDAVGLIARRILPIGTSFMFV